MFEAQNFIEEHQNARGTVQQRKIEMEALIQDVSTQASEKERELLNAQQAKKMLEAKVRKEKRKQPNLFDSKMIKTTVLNIREETEMLDMENQELLDVQGEKQEEIDLLSEQL